jgi:hypothetical protein
VPARQPATKQRIGAEATEQRRAAPCKDFRQQTDRVKERQRRSSHCIAARPAHIRLRAIEEEDAVANKEQKRSSREAKKPKQKKKADKRPSAKQPGAKP